MARLNKKIIKLKNDEEIIVRTLDTSDSEHHVDFSNHIYAESEYLFQVDTGPNTIEKSNMIITKFRDSKKNYAIGAFVNNKLAGLVYIWELSTLILYSKNCDLGISVRKAYRGKGIGQLLMNEAEALAKENGFKRMQFSVVSGNLGAISMYKKLGYLEEGLRKSSIYINGEYLDELFMGKILKDS